MCGICGIYSFSGGDISPAVRAMNGRIRHRGPDDDGYFDAPGVSLGHKRLSIIDLSRGHQPIYNEDGSCVIVYNGELYNYKELRAGLIDAGHVFTTETDTEVILHAYEQYGADCVSLFNGMFAFAVWDAKAARLFIARDRVGIKPLYYRWDEGRGRLAFASEIKAFLGDPLFKATLNPEALSDYLVFQNLLDDKTFFSGVRMLLPGCYMAICAGRMSITRYWDPSFQKRRMPRHDDYLASFREILRASVKRQLMSDVPLGAYLSGGFDSSSVASYAAELNGGQLDTFTGYFGEGDAFDERSAAMNVARRIGAVAHTREIGMDDFESTIFKIVYHLDEPRVGPGAFPQYHVSKLVSEHVKVVLTGHGGDELFCGYPLYKMHYFARLIARNPLHAFTLIRNLKPGEWKAAVVNILLPLVYPEMGLGLNLSRNHRKWRGMLGSGLREAMAGYDPLGSLRALLAGAPDDRLDRVQYLYLKTYLPSLFIVEDKVGMAHSIEARLPICDNEMIDFALSVPFEDKLAGYDLKHIVKEAMRERLPAELYNRPKMGFPTPIDRWFRQGLGGFVSSLLLDDRCLSRGVFDPDIIRTYLQEHTSGQRNRQHVLWQMLNVEIWHRIFVDGDDAFVLN
ncbi:MAG: asparagine synthase (glutamine-hydrolyzing) [Nitrospirae bacterium]|nr:asparagine synthase (glutamine-hydrolyzing) [Nitrospirota bacterium]